MSELIQIRKEILIMDNKNQNVRKIPSLIKKIAILKNKNEIKKIESMTGLVWLEYLQDTYPNYFSVDNTKKIFLLVYGSDEDLLSISSVELIVFLNKIQSWIND